jgi:signal transduction histidine kinase
VRDTGRGIPAEILPQITDPFFTTKRSEGGTGLGLAISQRIAADHGGLLEFESEVGRGTTAVLRLPLYITEVENSSEEGKNGRK